MGSKNYAVLLDKNGGLWVVAIIGAVTCDAAHEYTYIIYYRITYI